MYVIIGIGLIFAMLVATSILLAALQLSAKVSDQYEDEEFKLWTVPFFEQAREGFSGWFITKAITGAKA